MRSAGQVTGHQPGERQLLLCVRTQRGVIRRFVRGLPEPLLGQRPAALVVVDRGQPDEQRRAERADRAGHEGGLDQFPAARHISGPEMVVGGVHDPFASHVGPVGWRQPASLLR